MRVTHCVGFYLPDYLGGTEVYVQDLTVGLTRCSVASEVVAATDEASPRHYVWAGAPVSRYPVGWTDAPAEAAASTGAKITRFQELVLRTRPDVFHLHSWTSGSGLRQLAQAAALGIPCVVTIHVPSALCLRGTMLLDGDKVCDGHIEEERCTRCFSISRGLPAVAASIVAKLPSVPMSPEVQQRLGRVGSMLALRRTVATQAANLRYMAELSTRIVAPSQWVFDALTCNGVPAHKIVQSQQAVDESFAARGAARRDRARGANDPLRIGFVGRMVFEKGLHVLVKALRRLPRDLPVQLLVAGRKSDPEYLAGIEHEVAGDPRVQFFYDVEHEDLPGFLEKIDVLAVPSNYMETGPLVVCEAFAFGIPVLGADLGGIAERVRDGIDGMLLPFDDSGPWARAIVELTYDRGRLAALAANASVRRTMTTVAEEMAALYRDVLDEAEAAKATPA